MTLQNANSKIYIMATYNTTWEENWKQQAYLKAQLPSAKGACSGSALRVLVLFVQQKQAFYELSVVQQVNYELSIQNDYPIPLIIKLRNKIRAEKCLTRLDLKNTYYLICITQGHEWKHDLYINKGLYSHTIEINQHNSYLSSNNR